MDYDPNNQTVLIVEDQNLWREQLLGESVRALGLNVLLAATKDEALHLLDSFGVDLAVIDINLTEIAGNTDGLAVADHLEHLGKKTPIIIVSGATEGFQMLAERSYQVFARLRKDLFDLDEFIRLVETALAGQAKRG